MLQPSNREAAVMRYELSNKEWSIIRMMFPTKPRGVRRVDDRRVLNGIFWVLRSGAPWRDLPAIYGLAPLATIASFGGGEPASGKAS
jgi:transposase